MRAFAVMFLTAAMLGAGPLPASAAGEPIAAAARLANADSPYLRQHADNTVAWMEWGEEAFEKARRENRPILLSVGYFACHWCHVMEHESFMDPGLGKLINENFVPVLVDRERRPDVDEIYMLATQIIQRTGGWPNNVFLTPDRKPFFAGTYFPPENLRAILLEITRLWRDERAALVADSERVATAIDRYMTRRLAAQTLDAGQMASASQSILEELDELNGGFSQDIKFPQETVLAFLLRRAEIDGDQAALKAVGLTLDNILDGGIHDHAGGGFHRYAVDPQWRVPHFEKMLYNQAQLARLLAAAHVVTGRRRYGDAARRTLDYVLSDLTSPEGGFYSARDADSAGEEGTFYVWTPGQLVESLGKADGEQAARIFGVTERGDIEGKSVLHFPSPPEELAGSLGLTAEQFTDTAMRLGKLLARARDGRQAPQRDEKIIASWNGLMITAFAEAAQSLDEPRYREAALRAGGFAWERLRPEGKLKRAWYDGSASQVGLQEDYAQLALAFVALYDMSQDMAWLERGVLLTREMITVFADQAAGDFYMTAERTGFGRIKSRSDENLPSGNAAALELFALLSRRINDPEFKLRGEALLAASSGIAARAPAANASLLRAADMLLRGETGRSAYLARGAVRALARYDREKQGIEVTLAIKSGWHINSDAPLEAFLIPTAFAVAGSGAGGVIYPEPVLRKLRFHDKELALFERHLSIFAPATAASGASITAELIVQACSDELCLDPETAKLMVRAH